MNEPEVDTATGAVFRTLTVGEPSAGKRLDRFIVESVPDLSRAVVRTMIESGQVRLDGRHARKGDSVTSGARVDLLSPPPARDFTPVADGDTMLVLRFEDPDVVVVEKPAGVPTHPLRADETGTLANVIVAQYPETASVGFAQREPGLLHRLDTDTSGLVIVARSTAAFDALRAASREGKIRKRYVAVVEGKVPTDGQVEFPLVPHRKDPKRVEAVTPHVRLRAGTRTHPAVTRYRPVQALHAADGSEYTLVEVELESAFRHQVRVHLATIGHPLLGDAIYRGPMPPPEITLSRHFLHASGVRFPHPSSAVEIDVTSPLPAELVEALAKLGG